MAELETADKGTKGCCSPTVSETCCEPEAKSECCGAHGDGCGCAAGFESVVIRETHRVHDQAASAIIRATVPI